MKIRLGLPVSIWVIHEPCGWCHPAHYFMQTWSNLVWKMENVLSLLKIFNRTAKSLIRDDDRDCSKKYNLHILFNHFGKKGKKFILPVNRFFRLGQKKVISERKIPSNFFSLPFSFFSTLHKRSIGKKRPAV